MDGGCTDQVYPGGTTRALVYLVYTASLHHPGYTSTVTLPSPMQHGVVHRAELPLP